MGTLDGASKWLWWPLLYVGDQQQSTAWKTLKYWEIKHAKDDIIREI